MTEKVCSKCGESKPLEEFSKNKQCVGGRIGRCKKCINAYEDARKKKKRESFPPNFVFPEKKKCVCCGEIKDREHFSVEKLAASGLTASCRSCINERHKHHIRVKVKSKKKETKPTGEKKCSMCYEIKSFDRFPVDLRSTDSRASSCNECHNTYQKSKRASLSVEEKEQRRILRRKYKATHKQRQKEIEEKGLLPASGRVSSFIRNSLNRVLASTGKKKANRTETTLGYTREKLKARIETNFQPGMSWKNASEWHIDHIIPISHFLKRGEVRPHIINALCNLRPLWASDNLSKHNKLPEFLARKY